MAWRTSASAVSRKELTTDCASRAITCWYNGDKSVVRAGIANGKETSGKAERGTKPLTTIFETAMQVKSDL